jgi:hypothetical protein
MQLNERFQQCLERARALVSAYRSEAPAGCDPLNSFAGIAAVAVVGTTVGMAVAGGEDQPNSPDYSRATAEGVKTDASLLPFRRMVDAAAKLGQKITVNDPVTGEPTTYDFTGYGDAETSAAAADAQAKVALDIQKKYGSQFIDQAMQQLKQANPEGFAARTKLFDSIMAQQDKTAVNPVANTLQAQIMEELNKGGETDAATNREIEQFMTAQQTARGGGYGKADEYEQAMGMGQQAEARKAQRKQQALAWLTSGATPTDVEYRQGQQNMANLSNFISGQTPTAQFGQLSGAQQGAAPYMPGATGPDLNPNAGSQAAGYAQNTYNTQMGNPASNPWMQGLGLGMQGLGAVSAAGGKNGFGVWGTGGGTMSYPTASTAGGMWA